jgi:hypothetical protein
MIKHRINRETISEYPIGTKMMMNFGAMYPTMEGMVVDYRLTPASKHFPENVELVIDTEDGKTHYSNTIVLKGIGTYLLSDYMNGAK